MLLAVGTGGVLALAPAAARAASSTAFVTAPAQTIAGFGASGAWWVNDLTNFSAAAQSQAAGLLFTGNGIDLIRRLARSSRRTRV